MTAFFGELGKKVAEKWVSLLLLPSLLLAATAAVGVALGHAAALDGARLVAVADEWLRALEPLTVGAQVLLLGVALLACSGFGLVVRALSGLTRRLWLGSWGRLGNRLGAPLVTWRQRRWDQAHADGAAARRNAIALARPARPTWMGDQIVAVEARVHNQYGVDLSSWWPRLWLVVDEPVRSELAAARAGFDAAALLATWAIGYLAVGGFWWPAVVIAAGVGLTGWARGRAAMRVYATLVESAVDLHRTTVARKLDVLHDGQAFTTEVGRSVTDLFRKAT